MKNIFIGGILFLSVITQVSFFSNFFPAGVAPDIALLVIIIWTTRSDFHIVLKWAIVGGLFLDLISFWPVGTSIFSFVLAAFVTNSLGKRFLTAQFAWKFLIFSVIIAIVTVLNYMTVLALSSISSGLGNLVGGLEFLVRKEMLLKILYNLLIFSVIYWPLGKIDKVFAYYNKK